MNKIFKVIWSKSKQCYVVVSEMAKNTTGKKKIVVASILAGLAMSTMGTHVMAAGGTSPSNNVWGATTPGGVAIGQNSVASGATAVDPATGTTRVAPSIAIGLASSSAGLDTITIGIGAGNTKSYGISMGKRTNVGGDYGIALGYEASAMSDHAVAIGEQTRAPKMGATVMGVSARGYGQGSVSLGWQALAGADVYGSGININSNPYDDTKDKSATKNIVDNYQNWGDTAIGLRAVATGGNATALGRSARAAAENAIAIGGGNGNSFNNNTEKTEATAEKAVAVGYNANASARDTLALGTSSKASGSDALAIGKNANASDSDSIAIGQDTVSNNINSIALGNDSQSKGSSAIALGAHTKATDVGAVALGLKAEATKEGSISIGQESAASSLKAITIGMKSVASGENAAAYGNTAKAVGKNSLALGANTQATVEGGVALGAGSIANTVAGAGYNPNTGRTDTFTGLSGNALTSTWAAVSIGDGTNTRQLTGLAAGTNNTDAVNVAQLKSMNLAFTADGSTKGDVNLTNSALNVVGDSTYITTKGNNQTLTISGKKQTITVTDGTASASAGMADANNVAQAINQANAAQTISYKANGGTANTVKVSDGLNFTNGTTTVATVGANGQVTYDLNTTTKQSITDSSTAVNRTISLGGSTGSTTAKKLASGDVKFNIKGQTGTSALITTSASVDDVTIAPTSKLTDAVAAAENAANKNLSNISSSGETVIKNLAKGAAQDAVKVAGTGLATVSDNTVGGVKTYTVDVNTGNLVVAANGQVGAAGTTGASGAAGSNGVATTQNVATAINDAVTKAKASTTQALADAEHKFDGDTGTTSVRKHGEVLSIKGGVTNAADLATGNIGVVSDGAGTLNIRLAKVLSGLTSATFTTAGGNTTVINGDGVTITPSGTGASAISMTTDGINAGGKEVKGIADGTAADSAVSKGQMETAIANAQTAATSTEKVVAKTLSGDTNLATVTGQTGTSKGETYEVAVSENAVKNVAKAAAQDAVTVTGTGLATVSDNTAAGVKTYTVNVDEGKLVIDDTTGKVGAAGSTQGTTAGKNGVATTQNVATAINDAITKSNVNTAQALADAKHNFAGDDATVISRKHGEQLNIKGGASTTATDLTSGNIAVVGDTASGTLNIKMVKALTGLTSATFTDGSGNTQTVTGASSTIADGAGNTTTMTKGGLSTTDGTNTTTVAPAGVTATDGTNTVKLNGSGIDAGNTQIKNVGKATTDDAAVNKKQMDDAVKSATDATTALGNNTIALGSDAGSTTAKKLSTNAITFNIKGDTGANALITTSATGDNVTIAPTAKLTAAVTAAEKSADKDLSNISSAGKTVIKDLAVTSAQDAVNVTGTGLATVSDNTTGGVKTYTVNVDEGKLVLDDTTGKIGANGSTQGTTAGKNGVATTQNVATAINDAITKSNANTAQALADAEHKFDGDTGTTSVRKHGEVLSIKGGVTTPADLTTGNIGVVSDGAGTLNIRLAKVLSGLTSATFKDASGNTTMVTGGSTTIADTSGNTQTLAPTKSEIKDSHGVSTVTTKDGVTAKDASGQTTSLTKGGVDATDGNGNTTSLTNTGVSATDGNGHTTGLTNGGLSTTDGTNTTTVAPTGITATDGTNTVKLNGSGIDAGNTEIKNVGKATTDDAAVNKKQMDDAITKATADATHDFAGDDATVISRKHGEQLNIKGGASTTATDLTSGNIAVIGDTTTGTLNIKLAKVLTGLTSATFTDTSGNTTTVTGGSTTIADTSGNTQTLAPTKSEIKDNNGVSTVTTKDGVTAKDASGQTTSLTKGGVNATDGNGHTTGITNGGLSTTDGTNTTTVAPTGITATDGTNTVKLNGSGIDAGNTEIKNVGKATTDDAAVNKKQMDDAITKATADATHEFGGDDATVVSRKHGEKLTIKGGATTTDADLTSGNIAVIGDATNGALNIKLAKALTGLTSATFTDTAGNTTTVTGGSTTIADTSGNTQTLAPTKSEIKDNNGVSTVTTKDGVTAKDASGQMTSLTKGGVDATDGNGNTTSLTNTGVSATDGHGHTTGLTNGGLSTTDGTNTTTVAPTGMTATDGTNTVKVEGSGIDAGGTEIKHIAAGTAADSAVNKGQMDDAITKATADATHEFAGDTGSNSVRKHGEVLSIKGGVTDANKLSDNNIGVISDGAGTLNVKLSKDLTDLTSATFKDRSGNTQTVTGASSTITDGTGNTTAMTKGGLSTTDGTNTTTIAPTGVTATDGTNIVKLNGSGIDAGNTQIKNVGKATTDDAAVNKKQMDEAVKAASDATKALGNNTISLGGDSVSTTTAKALNTTGGIQFNIKGQTGTDALITTSASGDDVTITPTDKLINAVKAAEKSADKDLSNLSAAGNTHIQNLAKSAASWNVQTNGNGTTAVVGGDTVNFINGDNIAITNTGHAITIGTAKDVSFDKVTVGGMTLDKNGILSGISSITGSGTGAPTMTFNSQNGNTPANVSINSNLDMGGHRITGVGPAEKPTDAVNKQQVDQALRGLTGMADNAARQYASKAGANAAALAALKPIQYDPLEPTQIMAGVGNYKSQTAVALGMAHYTNENTMFNIGVSLDSHDNMVNAGVTHKFGYSPEKKAIPDRYKGGPISSIYVMQDEMQALLAKDQEKDAVISKQASEIDTLRQQNEDMQRKIDMILAKLQ